MQLVAYSRAHLPLVCVFVQDVALERLQKRRIKIKKLELRNEIKKMEAEQHASLARASANVNGKENYTAVTPATKIVPPVSVLTPISPRSAIGFPLARAVEVDGQPQM